MNTVLILATPLLGYLLLIPSYGWANEKFIVEWFGCGCPQIDSYGNIIHSTFNANDFTALFWSVVTIGATVAAMLLARRIPREKRWIRILYVGDVFLVCLCASYMLFKIMQWD